MKKTPIKPIEEPAFPKIEFVRASQPEEKYPASLSNESDSSRDYLVKCENNLPYSQGKFFPDEDRKHYSKQKKSVTIRFNKPQEKKMAEEAPSSLNQGIDLEARKVRKVKIIKVKEQASETEDRILCPRK